MTTLLDLMLAPVRDAGFVRSEAFEPLLSSERHETPDRSPRCHAAIDIAEVRPGRWVWRIEAGTPSRGLSRPLVDRVFYSTTREAAVHAAAGELIAWLQHASHMSEEELRARARLRRWAEMLIDHPPRPMGGR